jgi:hypothetical protein
VTPDQRKDLVALLERAVSLGASFSLMIDAPTIEGSAQLEHLLRKVHPEPSVRRYGGEGEPPSVIGRPYAEMTVELDASRTILFTETEKTNRGYDVV